MNPKKGLIGFFVLLLLISGIGLGLLVLDDQNDLSSRAAIGITSSLLPALPGAKMIESSATWTGDPFKLPIQITFNNVLWILPTEKDPVFAHLQRPITVRLVKGYVDLVTLKSILGESFTNIKPSGVSKSYLDGWRTQTYLTKFLSSEKTIDVWSNSLDISFIAVMPDDSGRSDITQLARGISSRELVKGTSTSDDFARLAATVRPSVVMILNNYCAQVKYTEAIGTLLAGRSYPYCLAQAGSGFFVSKDGFIATNGHVVTNLPEASLTFGVVGGSLDNLLIDFYQAYLSSQASLPVERVQVEKKVKEAHLSKETIYQFAAEVSSLFKKNFIKIEKPENHFFVQLGNTPIQLTPTGVRTGSDVLAAAFVDADYQVPDPVTGFSSSDVALLKVEGTNFPALPLGKIEDIRVGSDVLVVGFPGIVMGNKNILLDLSANAEPTFTKGLVSAFKQAKGDKKKLIQTDASINHGNSGGPAISSQGKVVGIATYGLTPEEGGGNYNFLRDIADLKVLMSKNKVSEDPGETYKAWQSGLENYWVSYLKLAKIDFEKVRDLYKLHPTVEKYLAEVESKINTPDDKTPRFSRVDRRLYMNLAGGVIAFSIVAVIVLTVSDLIDTKRRRRLTSLPHHSSLPPKPIQTF